MANMSYCRFQNTVQDLQECLGNMGELVSDAELKAKKELIEICIEIAEQYGDVHQTCEED
jgi:hypothetical protein